MLGSYYIRFIVVRDSVLIPLSLITSLVSYLARTEPSEVKITLLNMLPFLKKCCGPKKATAATAAVVVAGVVAGAAAPESEKPKEQSEKP
jgi:hypothetical protein